MAVFLLQQEDTAADSGFVTTCSGVAAGSVTSSHQMLRGGTAGTTEVQPDPDNTSSSVLAFQSDTALPEPNVTTWQSGDYVIRLNVTTGRTGTVWAATYICERTSVGGYNAVASLTGQTTAMDVGTQTMTVNRATDYTAAATSTVYIVCVFTGPPHGGSDVGITPSLIIDTPIDDGVQAGATVSAPAVLTLAPAGPTIQAGASVLVADSTPIVIQSQDPTVRTGASVLVRKHSIVDNYDFANETGIFPIGGGGFDISAGQSFTGNGGVLSRAVFSLAKSGSPASEPMRAKLYAHTGTFGVNGTPTGAALAVSYPLNPSFLTGSTQQIGFDFDETFTLVSGTNYFVVAEFNDGETGNTVDVGRDTTAPSHAGNAATEADGGGWTSDNTTDIVFEVLERTSPTTLVVSPQGPAVQSGASIFVDPQGLVITPHGPTISIVVGGVAATIEVSDPAILRIVTQAPTVRAGASIFAESPLSLLLQALDPTILAGVTIRIENAESIIIQAQGPTVQRGSSIFVDSPAALVIQPHGPNLETGALVIIDDPLGLILGPQGPTVQAGVSVFVSDAGIITFSIPGPTISASGFIGAEVEAPAFLTLSPLGPTIVAGALASKRYGVYLNRGVGRESVSDLSRDIGSAAVSEYTED